jgi:hypothetical protein
MRPSLRLSAVALGLSLALVFSACGDDSDDAADTTTSTTAPTTTTTGVSSTSPVAVFLNTTLVSAAEVQAALGLSAAPQPYTGTATAPAPPQGPLSLDGIVKVYPDPAYKGILEQGGATVGANTSYLVMVGASGYVVNVLAVKFKDAAGGTTFVQTATQVAQSLGLAKANAHPEVTIGVTPGAVLVVPPQAGSQNETVVTSSLYSDGVFYQVSASAPPGTVKDEVVIKLLHAQDAKYQKNKASLPAS